MAISLKSLTRKAEIKPPRITIYGTEGIGKTTFAAMAPNPVFIWTEDGQGVLDVDSFPRAKKFDDVIEALDVLYTEKHDFQTVVLDSLDWLEPLIWRETCKEHEVDSIEQVMKGFGKGYMEALKYWRQYIDRLNHLRDDKGLAVINIAHSTIKRFESPEVDPYDRWQIKIQDKASALIRENSDIVGFANYHVAIRSADVGFNKEVKRAVTSGKRNLYLVETPARQAKNRYNMPEEVNLDWNDFAQYLPGGEQFAQYLPSEATEETTEEAEEPQEAEQAQEPKKKERAA